MAFTMPGMFSNKRSGAGHHTGTMNPPKGGSDCRPGDCPCGNYGRFYASDTNSNWATSRSGEVARSGSAQFTSTLKRAEAAGVTWPLPEDWDEARGEAGGF